MCKVLAKKILSPLGSMCVGYMYIVAIVILFYNFGFHKQRSFFSFGIPINFMGKEINDYPTYFGLLSAFFIHQIINNWINNVVYPWIVNCVQDPKSHQLHYSKPVALLIVNLFALYSELDVMFLIMGVLTQFIFFLVLILANVISSTIVNWQYIKSKEKQYISINSDSRY